MDIGKLTVVRLKSALCHFGLPSIGNKAELITRLRTVDPQGEEILKLFNEEHSKSMIDEKEIDATTAENYVGKCHERIRIITT